METGVGVGVTGAGHGDGGRCRGDGCGAWRRRWAKGASLAATPKVGSQRQPPPSSFRRKPESTYPQPQGKRVNPRLRSTTEVVEAGKGRGPPIFIAVTGVGVGVTGAGHGDGGGPREHPWPQRRRSEVNANRLPRLSGESRNPRTPQPQGNQRILLPLWNTAQMFLSAAGSERGSPSISTMSACFPTSMVPVWS